MDERELELDCQTCAACCRHAFVQVAISPHESIIERHPQLVRFRDGCFELSRRDEACAALVSAEPTESGEERWACTVYEDRPRPCRVFERGSERCHDARRRIGLDAP
ncbi:MAG: YkgJ family cysteine cluster protein [Acidobacteriota bacterium]